MRDVHLLSCQERVNRVKRRDVDLALVQGRRNEGGHAGGGRGQVEGGQESHRPGSAVRERSDDSRLNRRRSVGEGREDDRVRLVQEEVEIGSVTGGCNPNAGLDKNVSYTQ